MPYANKKQKYEYIDQYAKEHYTSLLLKMIPEHAEMIRTAAAKAGQSNSQYVLQAVRERMARDAAEQTD